MEAKSSVMMGPCLAADTRLWRAPRRSSNCILLSRLASSLAETAAVAPEGATAAASASMKTAHLPSLGYDSEQRAADGGAGPGRGPHALAAIKASGGVSGASHHPEAGRCDDLAIGLAFGAALEVLGHHFPQRK
jgi:hypothetical protein